jgi:hypothetical protein
MENVKNRLEINRGKGLRLHPFLFGECVKIFEASSLILAIKIALRRGSLVGSLTSQQDRRAAILGVRQEIQNLLNCCEEAGLEVSAIAVRRLFAFCDVPVGSEDLVVVSLEDALSRVAQSIADECSLRTYFSLDSREAEKYANPLRDWESVVTRFREVTNNVIESAKCMALERYGAAVFHILLVAEYGVIQISNELGVSGDKPGWASLKRLQCLIRDPYPQRSELVQKHSALLENVVPLAIVVKDSWRHKLTHVDNQIVWMDTDFSPQVAEEIIAATRGFMRKLALELPDKQEENGGENL